MDKEQSRPGTSGASQYLVEVSHTPETCLEALDETREMGREKLNQWSWGCSDDDHTGYLLLNARSKEEALQNVPPSQRHEAKVVELKKYSVEEIESFHKQLV